MNSDGGASGNPGPVIILAEPQLGENIGTTARAMANFGLTELRLVNPRDGWPNESAGFAASGADYILDAVQLFDRVEDAIGDLHYVYAATARIRDMVKPVTNPQDAARAMRTRIDAGGRIGVLFGRERWGLNNDEVSLANEILTYPVNPDFSSLNLAQSVLVIAYEYFKGSGTPGNETYETLRRDGVRAATGQEVVGFFEHLESELDKSGFLRPPEKRPAMVRNIRNIFHRNELTDQDVRTLRGIIVSLTRTFSGGEGR
ncbi:MAG: RNA methyltransferase [Fimbriimonadaceae bacterium]|nr:RNA methyltransferase [Alphaproteobacteria bacterium]